MWADRIDFSGSVYYIRKNNVVKNLGTQEEKDETTGEMVQKTIQAQVGTADSRGFDLELTVHPVSTLAVTGGLGWQDYRIRTIRNIPILVKMYGLQEFPALLFMCMPIIPYLKDY